MELENREFESGISDIDHIRKESLLLLNTLSFSSGFVLKLNKNKLIRPIASASITGCTVKQCVLTLLIIK